MRCFLRFCWQLGCALAAVWAVGWLTTPVYSTEAAAAASLEKLRMFVGAYCLSCHSSDEKKGGLDLETLAADFEQPGVFDKWVRVHDRVQTGEMPPKERQRRPTAAEREALLKMLTAELTRAERARYGDQGRAVLRRLNRANMKTPCATWCACQP